jgi:UPF0716 protein FxsA
MSLLSRLALLFVGIPLLELFLLVEMGRWIGFLPTVGIVILTGVVGAGLARLEGLRTLWSIQGELARGRLPGNALFDGMAILVGGALLLTPGILTDLLGFSFLFPPTRKLLLRQIRRRVQERLKSGAIHVSYFSGFPGSGGGGRGPGPESRKGRQAGPSGGDHPVRPGEIVIEPRRSEEE